jgi:hypothetical protein
VWLFYTLMPLQAITAPRVQQTAYFFTVPSTTASALMSKMGAGFGPLTKRNFKWLGKGKAVPVTGRGDP